jgi:hypothetical protein
MNCDLRPLSVAGLALSALATDGVLIDGTTYYILLRCTTNSGMSRVVSSAVVYVQSTPPPVQFVYIGPASRPSIADATGTTLIHTSTTSSLQAWFGSFQLDTGVQQTGSSYKWSLGKTVGGTEFIPWTTLQNSTSFTAQLQAALQTYQIAQTEGRQFFLSLLQTVRFAGRMLLQTCRVG